MRKVVNQANFKYGQKHKIIPSGEVMTVPDDSFTISEILEKFTRGVDPLLTRNPIDMGEAELDDTLIQFNDLTDIDQAKEYLEMINEKKDLLNKKVKELEKAKKEKEKEDLKAQIRKQLEEEEKLKQI